MLGRKEDKSISLLSFSSPLLNCIFLQGKSWDELEQIIQPTRRPGERLPNAIKVVENDEKIKQ